jgi:hypothetical protein
LTASPVFPQPAHFQAIAGRKLQSLDGLRAIAIILVFFHHMKSYIPVVNLPVAIFQMYVWQGWVGVDLFFVLSGFLITGILIDTRESVNYFSGFYARRVLRIFPLYYFVLTGLVLLGVFLSRSPEPWASDVVSQLPLPQDRWVYFFLSHQLDRALEGAVGQSVFQHIGALLVAGSGRAILLCVAAGDLAGAATPSAMDCGRSDPALGAGSPPMGAALQLEFSCTAAIG